jgi:hypothetical protein
LFFFFYFFSRKGHRIRKVWAHESPGIRMHQRLHVWGVGQGRGVPRLGAGSECLGSIGPALDMMFEASVRGLASTRSENIIFNQDQYLRRPTYGLFFLTPP